ncbi:hypothetical protein K3495_g971 [Podosphaera aphanis]|nr:hypothetical protein K3495_g971 [Podosphaera aphanis]
MHNEYTAWKFKSITKWNLNHTSFETEFKKICDIINWLDGDACTRLQSKIGLFFSANENPSNWPWASSSDFFQELDRKHLTVGIKAIAVGSLNELKMVGKFKDFPSFISEFEKFADQADLSSAMRVYHLRRKVSEPLRIAVKNHIPAPPEDSITEWIELYYQFWKNQEADRQITGSSGNLGVGDALHNQGQNGNIKTGDPMDLDRMQLNRVRVTPAEWQYRRDHGLCNRCRGDDHYSRNCSSELAKRSKRRFDTADRDLQSGSRSGPLSSQDSYRGNYNSGYNLRPRQDSFQASQYPNYPLHNYSRNNEIKPRGKYSDYNGNRGGINSDRTPLRLQEIEESNYNPRSTYRSQPPCGTHLDEFGHDRGQVHGEVDADDSHYSHLAARRNGQGNGWPQHQFACGALLYKIVLIQAKSYVDIEGSLSESQSY